MIRKEGNHNVRRDLAIMLRSMDRELNRIGNEMVRDVTLYMDEKGINNDGVLRKSVNYQVEYSRGMFSLRIGAGARYAYFVHEGRAPGKMPPHQPIVRWVHRKLGIMKGAESVAFLIRRKIAQQGTKGRPFIAAVHKEWQAKLQARIDNAIAGGLANA